MKTYHLIIGACWYTVSAKTLNEAKQKALDHRVAQPYINRLTFNNIHQVHQKKDPSVTFLEKSTKLP